MRGSVWVAAFVSIGGTAHAQVTVDVSPGAPIADHVSCAAQESAMALAKGPSGDSLVVWQNELDSLHADAVMAGRIAADGTLRDPLGIYVAANTLASSRPVAAFDGAIYLVAWAGDGGVRAARISADGVLLDSSPITVAPGGNSTTVGIAASPGQFLLSWVGNGGVVAARLDAAGTILDPTPINLANASFVRSGPAAAFGGADYAVVWNQNGIQAARVTTAGAVVAPGAVDLVADTTGFTPDPAITFSGSEYLIAWDQGALEHMRVSTTLAPLSTPSYNYGAGDPPAVSFDGTNYLVAVEGTSINTASIGMERLSATEQYLGFDSLSFTTRGGFGRTASVFNGVHHLLAFEIDESVRSVRVAGDGSVLDSTPLTLAQTSNNQTSPVFAFDGASSYLVAWRDTRDTGDVTSVVVSHLDGTTPAAGGGVVVKSGIENSGGLAIARGRTAGSTGLVVWHEGFPRGIYAARISATGEIMDPNGFPITAGTEIEDGSLAVACTADTCMAVWEDSSFAVFGVRVSLATGAPIDDAPQPIGSGISPRIAASTNAFLVGISGGQAYRVPTSGQPTPAPIPARAGLGSWDIAWNGHGFTYAWSEMSGASIVLRVAHLDDTGAMVGEPATIASLDQSVFVTVVDDGTQAIITFVPWLFFPPAMPPDFIFAARYTDDGRVLDPDGVHVPISASRFAAAASGVNGFLVSEQIAEAGVTSQVLHVVSLSGENPNGPDADGGCCDAGDRRPPIVLVSLVAVAFARRRRRRRT